MGVDIWERIGGGASDANARVATRDGDANGCRVSIRRWRWHCERPSFFGYDSTLFVRGGKVSFFPLVVASHTPAFPVLLHNSVHPIINSELHSPPNHCIQQVP
jgi:hypothetical protein